jgi:glycosyltransferase involved in cell wall biosynthesis
VFAVIPARNEGVRLRRAIQNVRGAGIEHLIVVVNGCQDDTRDVAASLQDGRLSLLTFAEPLGVDIPRAVGAAYAYRQGAQHVLFYDGDLIGHHRDPLQKMVDSARRFDLDLGLTDPYGTAHGLDLLHDPVLSLRRDLGQRLGLEARLGLANPAHGPHVVSRRLLRHIPLDFLAKPPLVLAYAAQRGLHLDVLAHIPHARLGSAHKGVIHVAKIRETIIGDLLEALCFLDGRPRSRRYLGRDYDGYESERRFDLLERFARSLART